MDLTPLEREQNEASDAYEMPDDLRQMILGHARETMTGDDDARKDRMAAIFVPYALRKASQVVKVESELETIILTLPNTRGEDEGSILLPERTQLLLDMPDG